MCENNTESERTPVAFMIIPQHFYCYLHILELQFKTLKAFVSNIPYLKYIFFQLKTCFSSLKVIYYILLFNMRYRLTPVVEPTLEASLLPQKAIDMSSIFHQRVKRESWRFPSG